MSEERFISDPSMLKRGREYFTGQSRRDLKKAIEDNDVFFIHTFEGVSDVGDAIDRSGNPWAFWYPKEDDIYEPWNCLFVDMVGMRVKSIDEKSAGEITFIESTEEGKMVWVGSNRLSLKDLFENYIRIDNSPCGNLVSCKKEGVTYERA